MSGIEADIIAGNEGQFDVLVDGKTVFSKEEVGRFPFEEEVLTRLN